MVSEVLMLNFALRTVRRVSVRRTQAQQRNCSAAIRTEDREEGREESSRLSKAEAAAARAKRLEAISVQS
jgi:hypothetical protein